MASNPEPMISPKNDRDPSPTPSPNDHIQTLAELLREGGPDLIRRWVASLLLAPRDERERIVEAVERRMTELYAPAEGETETSQRTAAKQDEEPMVHLTSDVKQRAGYVEETVRSYQRAEPSEHRESEQRAADSTTSAQSKRSAS